MYWQIAGISAILTLPFLFAAAIQALLRSDLTLLLRATFGYLPLAMLAVSVAAPITMLLLAASDQLSAVVCVGRGQRQRPLPPPGRGRAREPRPSSRAPRSWRSSSACSSSAARSRCGSSC